MYDWDLNPNGESGTANAAEDPRLIGARPTCMGARLLSASGTYWYHQVGGM